MTGQPIGFPGGSDSREICQQCGRPGSDPWVGKIPWRSEVSGLGRSPGEWNGYPFQYSGLENSMDRGAWQARIHEVAKSQTLTQSQKIGLKLTIRPLLAQDVKLDWSFSPLVPRPFGEKVGSRKKRLELKHKKLRFLVWPLCKIYFVNELF